MILIPRTEPSPLITAAFAAALAKIENAELLTGDPEFKLLEKEINITWLK